MITGTGVHIVTVKIIKTLNIILVLNKVRINSYLVTVSSFLHDLVSVGVKVSCVDPDFFSGHCLIDLVDKIIEIIYCTFLTILNILKCGIKSLIESLVSEHLKFILKALNFSCVLCYLSVVDSLLRNLIP